MKTKTDRTAAAALRVLSEIHRELVLNRRAREKRERQAKQITRAALAMAEKSQVFPPEIIAAVRRSL